MDIQGLNKHYGDLRVLNDFTLHIPDERFVALYGPSGSGKTTLLHILAGLIKPDSGQVQGLQGKKIACVFQEDRLLPWLTALENVAVVGDPQDVPAAQAWLVRVGLGEAMHQLPDTLSGGQRRRVALARALHYGGDVLLMDEPFKGLDDTLKQQVMGLVAHAFAGRTAMLITHDRQEALHLCDQILVLQGPPLQLAGRVAQPAPGQAHSMAQAGQQLDKILQAVLPVR